MMALNCNVLYGIGLDCGVFLSSSSLMLMLIVKREF